MPIKHAKIQREDAAMAEATARAMAKAEAQRRAQARIGQSFTTWPPC